MTGIVESVKKTLSRRKNKNEKPVEATPATQQHDAEDHDDIDEHNYDQYEEADDETIGYLHQSVIEGESSDKVPAGTMLQRLIFIGNKKTEQQIARELAEQEKQQSAPVHQQPPTITA